jgi:hypothetical protein
MVDSGLVRAVEVAVAVAVAAGAWDEPDVAEKCDMADPGLAGSVLVVMALF